MKYVPVPELEKNLNISWQVEIVQQKENLCSHCKYIVMYVLWANVYLIHQAVRKHKRSKPAGGIQIHMSWSHHMWLGLRNPILPIHIKFTWIWVFKRIRLLIPWVLKFVWKYIWLCQRNPVSFMYTKYTCTY